MIHVMPLQDTKTHQATPRCACSPLVEDVGGVERVCVHHAWDCREPFERMTGEGKSGKPWAVVPVDDPPSGGPPGGTGAAEEEL